jgi:hypothetical protein
LRVGPCKGPTAAIPKNLELRSGRPAFASGASPFVGIPIDIVVSSTDAGTTSPAPLSIPLFVGKLG